mmetsp:Transcript_59728/g.176987  ORF Transcript_59728/g.176987 Transcript_59728/m.176987 type:complete len:94 (-) Transcript_59728:2035-2316(-)
MCLHILPKFEGAVFEIVGGPSIDNQLRADRAGCAIARRDGVDPEDCGKHQGDGHEGGDPPEGGPGKGGRGELLDGENATFDFRDVLILVARVE